MQAKMTTFIIGMIMIGLFVSVYMVSLSGFSESYSRSYDNTSFENYQRLAELNDKANEIHDASIINEKDNIIDIIGGYFSSAYKSMSTAGKSIQLLIGDGGMIDSATEDLHLGSAGQYFRTAFAAIIIILVVVGILFRMVFKVDV